MISINKSCVNCGACVRACPRAVLLSGKDSPAVDADKECMYCMHCAAACGKKAIRFSDIKEETLYPAPAEEPLAAFMQARRSIRNFSGAIPDRDVIRQALDIAAWAPSGKNRHTNSWSVLWGRAAVNHILELAERIAPNNAIAAEILSTLDRGKNLITCNAPCAILAYIPGNDGQPLDAAIATAYTDLLLREKGIATCWGGYLAALINSSPEIGAYAGLPGGARVFCTLLAGYPNGESYLNIPYRPKADVHWIENPC